jgi:hypothetical protein
VRAVLLLVLVGTAHADDLPSQVVARPPTLPGGMIEIDGAGAYDATRVLGVITLAQPALDLEARWGKSSRTELALATRFDTTLSDRGWSREVAFRLRYAAWRRGDWEVAPALTVPLSFHTGADLTSTIVLGAGVRWHASDTVLVTLGDRLLPEPIRPATAFDIGADAQVALQLAPRLAAVAGAVFGELTIVGQTDRGVAPWHHLPVSLALVYATAHRLDVTVEVHADADHPPDGHGAFVAVARRFW